MTLFLYCRVADGNVFESQIGGLRVSRDKKTEKEYLSPIGMDSGVLLMGHYLSR